MYNRLFTKILDSSIWLEPIPTRIIWITLIASMNEDSYCHYSAVENLARRAGVTVDEAQKALECLMAPDPNSADPDNDGRRIERIPGGFIILNGPKYRSIFNKQIEREQTRLRVKKFRNKPTVTDSTVTPPLQSVITVLPNVTTPPSASASASASAETNKKKEARLGYSPESRVALFYLNEKTGCKFRENASNLGLIDARLSEPDVSISGVREMIDRQFALWGRNPDMFIYLRPKTLFGKEKFGDYYALKDIPIPIQEKRNGQPHDDDGVSASERRERDREAAAIKLINKLNDEGHD